MELSKPLKSVFPAWWPGSVTALQNWSITPSHSCLECHLPGKPQQSVSEHCPYSVLCLNHLLWKPILEKANSCYWPPDVSFPQTLEGDWESSIDGTRTTRILFLTTYKMNTDILHHPNIGNLCFLLLWVGVCALTLVGVSVCWGQRTTWVLFLLRNYLLYVLLRQDLALDPELTH